MRIILIMSLVLITTKVSADIWDYDVAFRLRHQQVNDHWLPDATATTLLGRGEVHWQSEQDISFLVQYDQVWAVDKEDYNSIAYWNKHSPIPDPPGGELNQLKFDWQFAANWRAIIGRQVISFNNERHIGNAAYWQNDQTYDALSLRFNNSFDLTIQYSYVDKVHRIFGDNSRSTVPKSDYRYQYNPVRSPEQWGNHQHQSHLLNAEYHPAPQLTLSAFAYLLDNRSLPAWSTDTLGFRIEGAEKPNKLKYNYHAELAWQQAGKNHPEQYHAWYLAAEVGLQYRSHRWDLGYEYLGQDNNFGFNTNLATNHKFLGWADIFSRYSAMGGVEDIYLSYAGRNGKLRWKLVGHHFSDVESHSDIGYEFDFELAWRYSRKLEFKLLAANYQTRSGLATAAATQYDLSTWMLSVAYNL
ncbi:hypothetical protein [Thalassotalea sp. G2M2-11]|uniref:hypothetical protein n=1 Tax=Thalassotalea sp. G2M2-11 TaxID=2787627 RepID=UPI0019D0F724|nr:hypothetical protein [Thalassotalea sp. G2M2-11]